VLRLATTAAILITLKHLVIDYHSMKILVSGNSISYTLSQRRKTMPVNLMGIMKLTGLQYSRVHGSKHQMGVADGSWHKRSHWAVGLHKPRVTSHTMNRYAREGFVAAAKYKLMLINLEEAVDFHQMYFGM
jgi:hypothetical protein